MSRRSTSWSHVAGAIVTATAFCAALAAGRLWFAGEALRIREAGYFVLDQFFFLRGVNIYRELPAFFAGYWPSDSLVEILSFAGAAWVANLPFVSVVVALTIGALAIAPRMRPFVSARVLPIAFVVACLPFVYRVSRAGVHEWVDGTDERTMAAAVPTLAYLTLAAYLIWRRREQPAPSTRWTSVGLGLVVAFGAAAGLTALQRPTGTAAQGAPNILLISIDSLRSDHLSAYGYGRATSPRLKGLAAEGALFKTAVAPTSWTLPSHMSLLTGLDTLGHGVNRDDRRLAPSVPTLAEKLQAGGYETAAVVGAPFLNASWGFSRGFDLYDDFTVGLHGSGANHFERTSLNTAAAAQRWLRSRDARGAENPFFLFVHYWDVHYDYRPPRRYREAFDTGYKGPITGRNYELDKRFNAKSGEDAIEHVKSLYDGEILFTDEWVGRLLDELTALGIAEETAVIVTADHGEEFFEHGGKGHRRTLYDEVTLIPLIMRLPGQAGRGLVIEEPVRLVDVAPTLETLAGVREQYPGDSPPLPYEGRSLLPLLEEETPSAPRLGFMSLHNPATKVAVRSSRYKFIRTLGAPRELYDLESDPAEAVNLAEQLPEVANDFDASLEKWVRDRGSVTSLEAQTSGDQENLLRGLGYIQ